MRIVIDLQGAQCNDTQQAFGRYCLSITQAIIRHKGDHEVVIVLNGLFSDTIEPIRAALNEFLSQEMIRVWYPPKLSAQIDAEKNVVRRAGELTREAFLIELKPDVIYLTSVFEGLHDPAITSIGLFTHAIPTAVTLYDQILETCRTTYLDDAIVSPEVVEFWYENKLDQLRRANLILTISESARQNSIKCLGLEPHMAINIGIAADSRFQRIEVTESAERNIREHYSLSQSFLMYVGGIGHQHNVEKMIEAFALLPEPLRKKHQLLIVCSAKSKNRHSLEILINKLGLSADNIIVTGFVPKEDLITLYNLCEALIAPSSGAGFNMVVLEAMSCGAAVIGSDNSSMAEIIEHKEARFDPDKAESIAEKIFRVLTDRAYHLKLVKYGLEYAKKSSWDACGKRAVLALEALQKTHMQIFPKYPGLKTIARPRLAYISPLPPLHSGISDYSAELLPELSRFYDIDLIVEQEIITNPWAAWSCSVRTTEWFSQNADHYDRVMYHFGNSEYHRYMFDLLARIPGIVVIHDFFLSGIVAHMDVEGLKPHSWTQELYHAHGYLAVMEHAQRHPEQIVWKYPCNRTVLEQAQGVIVHSHGAKQLGEKWLDKDFVKDWTVIPLLRAPAITITKAEARRKLGINDDVFLICSFGLMGASKENRRLLDAWLASKLSKEQHCLLVFVGNSDATPYTQDIRDTIRASEFSSRIQITGWTDTQIYRLYLAAADIGVQLRSHSRGETSAAVLDCMNYGLPVIVNANGSMAELPKDAVWMLADDFHTLDLSSAMEKLWKDKAHRIALGSAARKDIQEQHAPHTCAKQYVHAIEHYHAQSLYNQDSLVKSLVKLGGTITQERTWLELAQNIAQNQSSRTPKQLFLDVSAMVHTDLKTGIQRVVRSILLELLTNPPEGFRVEPVYAIPNSPGYHYARKFTLNFLGCGNTNLSDTPAEVFAGDIFLMIDLHFQAPVEQKPFFDYLKQIGVPLYTVVYDLLPILHPDQFIEGTSEYFTSWLAAITQGDGAICISRAVANELIEWLDCFGGKRLRPFKIGWFHLGANVAESTPTLGLPSSAQRTLNLLSQRPSFLMVGTIEPRKEHRQTLAAFELLWSQGEDVNLVIVGKRGWVNSAFIHYLETHKERDHRLFWLEGISDEYLEKVYTASTCLIAASIAEGFGLPLIEAAQHEIPLIVRDIPAFVEVAGQHAFYFSGKTPRMLANSIHQWLQLDLIGKAPQSDQMPWLTWKQSTQSLLNVILNHEWSHRWMPSNVMRFKCNRSPMATSVGDKTQNGICTTHKAGCLIFGPYISLAAGLYSVIVTGTLGSNGLGTAWMDVTSNSGSQTVKKASLNPPDESGNFVSLTIDLKEPLDQIEVRVWVDEVSDLSVSMIEIAPIIAETKPQLISIEAYEQTIANFIAAQA